MLFIFYFTCSSHLLYRRKLKTSLHRRHPKHASPCFPPMRAIHNKDPPVLLNPEADACGTVSQIIACCEKHFLMVLVPLLKNSELRVCHGFLGFLIRPVYNLFLLAKQQFHPDKAFFFLFGNGPPVCIYS